MQILNTLSALAGHVTGALETRMRLFAAELELERIRTVRLIFLAVIGVSTFATALLAAVTLVVLVTPAELRIQILAAIVVTLFITAFVCIGLTMRAIRRTRDAFSASREALKQDATWLASLIKK